MTRKEAPCISRDCDNTSGSCAIVVIHSMEVKSPSSERDKTAQHERGILKTSVEHGSRRLTRGHRGGHSSTALLHEANQDVVGDATDIARRPIQTQYRIAYARR